MLKDITPEKHKCDGVATACPAVYKAKNGNIVIVGKRVGPDLYDQLKDRVGHDEAAVEISESLIENTICQNCWDNSLIAKLSDG